MQEAKQRGVSMPLLEEDTGQHSVPLSIEQQSDEIILVARTRENPTPIVIQDEECQEEVGVGEARGILLTRQMPPEQYLAKLNEQQREAVVASPEGGLQILAGPGSGKTATLTTRVAHLITHYKIQPETIIVVTFTNRAATEMKARLALLIGSVQVARISMGTFHSVCVRYVFTKVLKKHGDLIQVPKNFVIVDQNDAAKVLKRAIDNLPPDQKALSKGIKPGLILNVISTQKSKNIDASMYVVLLGEKVFNSPIEEQIAYLYASLYQSYTDELTEMDGLDFDDLLMQGLKLVENHPGVVKHVKTVLVDEFQDTNAIQYQWLKCVAKSSGSITIVGDPDQSIYGWRNADIENLNRMTMDFRPSRALYLEHNYRSSATILGVASALIKQDCKRIPKTLKPTFPPGASVVIHNAEEHYSEADFIACQIKLLIAHSGGLLNHGDFALLVRFNALTRQLEESLIRHSIPYNVVAGHKFFDRAEIKDILSYLQLIENPTYNVAFERIINVPKCGLGEKSVQNILAKAKKNKISPVEVCRRIANEDNADCGVSQKSKISLRSFVNLLSEMKAMADNGMAVTALIETLLERIQYQAHLVRMYGKSAEEKWLNVTELLNYAQNVADQYPNGIVDEDLSLSDDEVEMEEVEVVKKPKVSDSPDVQVQPIVKSGDDDEGKPLLVQPLSSNLDTPLQTFLTVSMLATGTDTEGEGSKKKADIPRVAISTIHAAKGLEWPVIFVPACEAGTMPFVLSTGDKEFDEERRLLYVAITRARLFCTISWARRRMRFGEMREALVSPFLETLQKDFGPLFVSELSKITVDTRQLMARVLNRDFVDEAEAEKKIRAYEAQLSRSSPRREYVPWSPRGFQGTGGWNSSQGSPPRGSPSQGQSFQQSPSPGSTSPGSPSQGRYSGSAYSKHGSNVFVSSSTGGGSTWQMGAGLYSQTPNQTANDSHRYSFGQGQSQKQNQGPAPIPADAGFKSALASFKKETHDQGEADAKDLSLSNSSTNVGNGVAPAKTGFTKPRISQPMKKEPSPAEMPETRASIIKDVVLINPTTTQSTSRDLLAGFQANESVALDSIKHLAKEVETQSTTSAAVSFPRMIEGSSLGTRGKRKSKSDATPKPPKTKAAKKK